MKDMLSFLVARDTMHQNQWLAAWEELGEDELQEVSYAFMSIGVTDDVPALQGRRSSGRSSGRFTTERMRARGQKPELGRASPRSASQAEQVGRS